MNRQNTFAPSWGRGVELATSTSSGSVEVGAGSFTVCITNKDGTDGVFVRTGDSTVTALDPSDYFIPPNGQVTLTKVKEHTHVAAIAEANTPTIHVIPGYGV